MLHSYTITNAIDDGNVLKFRIDYFKTEKNDEKMGKNVDKVIKNVDKTEKNVDKTMENSIKKQKII